MRTICGIEKSEGILDKLGIRVATECMRARRDTLHCHDFTQICYTLSGTTSHIIDGKEYFNEHGSCVVIPPFTSHTINSSDSEDTPINVFITFFDDGFARYGYDYFSYYNAYASFEGMKIPHYAHFEGEKLLHTDSIVREMSNEFFKHFDMSRERIAALLSELLKEICLTIPQNERITVSDSVKNRTEAIRRAVKYIGNNYDKKISVDTLAEIASMSRRSFQRSFHEITGSTTSQIIISCRLSRATQMITLTDKSLSEIADEIGIYDKSRLSKLFLEYYGMTPTEYRRIYHAETNRVNYLHHRRWAWLESENLPDGGIIQRQGEQK